MESWYGTNYQGLDEAKAAQEERRNQPSRFWMKPGETRRLLFLDEVGFTFNEHKVLKIPNDWKTAESETCPGPGCPLCEQGNQRLLTIVHTVLDFDGYKDREGKEHDKMKKHLFVMGLTVADIVRENKKNWGGLKGHLIRVTRKTERDARTGSSFDHCLKEGRAIVYNLEDVAARGIDIVPFNYVDIFKPKSLEALNAKYGRVAFTPEDFSGPKGGAKPASALASAPMPTPPSEFNAQAGGGFGDESDDVPFN